MTTEKLCVFCTNWKFDAGWSGTEITAGDAAEVDCKKGHFKNVRLGMYANENEFRKSVLQAVQCPDYEQVTP